MGGRTDAQHAERSLWEDKEQNPQDVSWSTMVIKDAVVAGSVSEVLTKTFSVLGESILDVNKRCSEEEAAAYRDKIGDIFYIITFKLLEPSYEQHPHLKPADWV